MTLRTLALLAVAAVSLGFDLEHGCGNSDPDLQRFLNAPAVISEQVYVNDDLLDSYARSMQVVENYNSTFIPLSDLDAMGLSSKIRIKSIWDPVDLGDTFNGKTYECQFVGQSITVSDANGNDVLAPSFCQAKHIVTGVVGSARGAIMRSRTNHANTFFSEALKVRPILDGTITIDPVITNNYFTLNGTVIQNADLVIIMTARPSPNKPIAGFATCLQRDQYRRCTVGWFNWVPELINVEETLSPDTIASELHTALHETVHVLGGMGPGISAASSPFIDDTGNTMAAGLVWQVALDAGYNKQMTYIVTPRVKNISRTYFGCSTMIGFPLEDVKLGQGTHWEARLAGPEFMSYGTNSGLIYISDLTFAFLEDTNQYIANYSMAGKLTPNTADDFSSSSFSFLQRTSQSAGGYVPPPPPSPGALTWGKGEGCSFVNGNARTWPEQYTCSKQQEYGCTPDHRMSAVCVISQYTAEPTCASYGEFVQGAGPQCGVDNTNDGCVSGGGCGIPLRQRYFQSDAAAVAASGISTASARTTGGFSNAMDYVPVFVGYWSCMDSAAVGNSSATTGDGGFSLSSVSSLFGSSSDMSLFGGQARCQQCRCFKSSLLELTKSINPAFTTYGLCYASNCYKHDYLQVGIKGILGGKTIYWYACPPGGGKLYIPGFTGSFHCPNAVSFCAMETVTGQKYPEQNIYYEYIFWGSVLAVCLFFFFACAMPCCRDKMINCGKRCCGASQFDKDYYDDDEVEAAKYVGDVPHAKLVPWASWTVFAVNFLTLVVGLAMMGLTVFASVTAQIYDVALTLLGLSFLIALVSAVGVFASRKRAEHGPSCWLLLYFYANVILMILLLWAVIYNIALNNWRNYVQTNWSELSQVLPSSYRQGSTTNQQIDFATGVIQSNMKNIAALAAAVLAVYGLAIIAAIRLIHFRTLASMTLAVMSHVYLVTGFLIIGVGFYLFRAVGATTSGVIIAVVLAVGFFMVSLACIAYVGIFRKNTLVIMVYMVLVVAAVGLLCYAIALFVGQQGTVAKYVDGLSDVELGKIATALGLSVTKDDIVVNLADYLNQLALAAGLLIIINVVILWSGISYAWAVKVDADAALSDAPGDADVGAEHAHGRREPIAV